MYLILDQWFQFTSVTPQDTFMNEKTCKINSKFDRGANVRRLLQYIGKALGKWQKVSRFIVIHAEVSVWEF